MGRERENPERDYWLRKVMDFEKPSGVKAAGQR